MTNPLVRGASPWWLRWRVTVFAFAAAISYLFQVIPNLPGWAAWLTGIMGTILTGGAVWAHRVQLREAEEIAQLAKIEAIVALQGLVLPAVRELKALVAEVTSAGRSISLNRVCQLIIDLASQIRPDARASLYRLKGSGRKRSLVLVAWRAGRGRRFEPRPKFGEGDQSVGDDMFKMLKDGTFRFERDVRALPHDWFVGTYEYGTYIAVPLKVADHIYGFLGVDVREAGQLTETDVDTMLLLADILVTAIAAEEQAKKRPTSRSSTGRGAQAA